jgi:hypothetical protein
MSKYGVLIALLLSGMAGSAMAQEQTVWKFDNLTRIAGMTPKVEGDPTLVDSPVGKAVQFNGTDTAMVFPSRPLVGAKTFTEEVILHPDTGAAAKSEQRVLHISETDPKTGLDAALLPSGHGDPIPRIMCEVHETNGQWFLHVYFTAYGQGKAAYRLNSTTKLHPYGAWYAVAMTYDGKIFRSYVNGVLEAQEPAVFVPQGPGRVAVGTRMDHASYLAGSNFKGAIAEARFTARALAPGELLKVPSKTAEVAATGGVFDNASLSTAANWVGDRTGPKRGDVQQKATLPDATATQFEQAKRNSAPLATAITTLGCGASCAALASSISGPGAVMDAIYTTGAVVEKESTEDYLYNLTVVSADKKSGEVGAETVSVTLGTAPPTHRVVHMAASCIVQSQRNGSGFVSAFWTTAPSATAPDLHPGDTVSVTAPACGAAFGNGFKTVKQASFLYEGGKPLSLAKPHFEYVAAGPQ